jgi:hypothetical protein
VGFEDLFPLACLEVSKRTEMEVEDVLEHTSQNLLHTSIVLEQSLVLLKLWQMSTDGLICIQKCGKSVGVCTGDLYVVRNFIRHEKQLSGALGTLTSRRYLIGPQTKATKSLMFTNKSRILVMDSMASRNVRNLVMFLFVRSDNCVFWMLATVKCSSSMVVSVKLLCSLWVKRALKLFSSRSNVVMGMLVILSGADGIGTTQ